MVTAKAIARSRKSKFLTLGTAVNMGRAFGNLGVRMRGVVTYSLSPYEQKSFAGAFTKGFPNLVHRFAKKTVVVGAPLFLSYLYYDYLNKTAVAMNRKNPADFANDE